MDELLRKHITIMDKYDPENRIGLVVDEWGNWHDVEPGTNPGFLYQQNTLRDALVASVNLDLFNNYCRRVKMANIAQTVNVLQAMILTQGDKLVKTPSFYVFKMYKVHHDATLLPTTVKPADYIFGDEKVPALSVSSSKSSEGFIHITLSNLDPNKPQDVEIDVRGVAGFNFLKGEIITGEKINSYNDFGKAEEVAIKNFSDAKKADGKLAVKLPAKSVVMLELK